MRSPRGARSRRDTRTCLLALAVVAVTAVGCDAAGSAPASPTAASSPASSSSGARPTTTPATSAAPGRTSASPDPTSAPATTSRTTPTPRPGAPVALPPGVAPEASGLAAGPVAGTFWTVDDATGTAAVVAVRADGSLVGTLAVTGMTAGNAEALAVAACGPDVPGRCLFVGDIGDHVGRDAVTVYRVREPVRLQRSMTATADVWRYRYAGGPRNAESLMVTDGGEVVVVDKPGREAGRRAPHGIWRGRAGGGTLQRAGTLVPPLPAVPLQSLLEGDVVTDAALDDGGGRRRVLLQFYDQVVAYQAPRSDADPAGFPGWPHRALPVPDLVQAEGITGLGDGCGFASVSEEGPGGTAAHLVLSPCR